MRSSASRVPSGVHPSRPARLRACLAVVVTAGALASCGAPEPQTPVDFVVPRTGFEPFLATPFPSDLLVRADGSLDLGAFPNPSGSQTLEDMLRVFEQAPAWSSTGSLYFHVPAGVDEASLPADAAASLQDDASMFLVQTDTLQRIPIRWQVTSADTRFLPAGTVAVQPLLGAVPHGRFALVVTRDARARDGTRLGPSTDLRALTTCAPLDGTPLYPVSCGVYQSLTRALGLGADDVAMMQIVTPQDATAGLVAGAEVAREETPVVDGLRKVETTSIYTQYRGTVRLAQFQAGVAPYGTLDGTSGGFVFGDDGRPLVLRREEVEFVLVVPRTPMPAGGYPLVVNGHGTGGDLTTGLGTRPGSEAFHVVSGGAAMLTISEPLHAGRAGYQAGNEELATFNFLNPPAGRDNWRQSALEKVQLVTMAQSLVVPASVTGGSDVHIDPSRIGYFGHSQGGIVGALFVAVEDRIRGALLSGAGAGFGPSIVAKKDPVEIANVVRFAVALPDDEVIDDFHPLLMVLQTWVDAADPINYGPLWRHRTGRTTPHLVVTSGLVDTYTPPANHAALAGAYGIPLMEPVQQQLPVLDLLGIAPVGRDVAGNARDDDGHPLTVAMLQFRDDGHFAIYDNTIGHRLFTDFFSTLWAGVPSVSSR